MVVAVAFFQEDRPGRVMSSRGISAMALGTIASRLTGLLRNVVFVQLGLNALTDAYNLANTSPNLFYELVVGGALSATLVPLFVGFVRTDPLRTERARRSDQVALNAIVTLALVVVVGMSLALWIGAPWFLRLFPAPAQGWGPGQFAFAVTLLRMFAPQVACYGGVTLTTALLHSQRKFAVPMIAPIVNNLLVTAVFWFVGGRLDRYRDAAGALDLRRVNADPTIMRALGWGTTAGVLVMLLVAIPAVQRSGLGLRPVWQPQHPAVKELLRLSGWTMGYVAANQVALFFVYGAAKRSGDGELTAYTLANSVFFQLPHGVIAVSIMASIQPTLSQAFLDRRRGDFRRRLARSVRMLVVFMTPAAVGYILLARPITELVAAHGRNTVGDARQVGNVLMALAIGLPSFSIYLLLMGALKALRDTRATFEINAVENALNIVIGAVLFTRWGVIGLAVGFACAYIISALIAWLVVSRRTKGLEGMAVIGTIGRSLVASGAMTIAIVLVGRVVGNPLLRNRPALLSESTPRFWPLLITVALSVVVGSGVYLATCTALRVPEVRPVIALPARFLQRMRTSQPSQKSRRSSP
jgi:putative peptidoglycan lipid II flippase